MTTATHTSLSEFHWTPQPEAEAVVHELVGEFLRRCPTALELRDRMTTEAGIRFIDVVDHISLPFDYAVERRLQAAGFVRNTNRRELREFVSTRGNFPHILFTSGHHDYIALVIKVESVVDFALAMRAASPAVVPRLGRVSGDPGAPVRSLQVEAEMRTSAPFQFRAIERHGYGGIRYSHPWSSDTTLPVPPIERVVRHAEALRLRTRRSIDSAEAVFDSTAQLIDESAADLGINYACDLFFTAEREYWMRRNRAAQVQYARQQRLGLGWANHDHHTYRSSREHFTRLVSIWEKLGFVCRERFYAGAEAGWGAQVMEHPVCGIVTFNDVDLSPDELMTDFAHEPLPPRKELGTVGLWCALHGESFLEAGMHHLECTFDFDALKRQLESDHGIRVMKPFTDLPHLKQAFTEGERWPVRPERIDRLLKEGRITAEQAGKFRTEGAIGSHLENLERNAGFKGFNQKGVSEIIAITDPRRQP